MKPASRRIGRPKGFNRNPAQTTIQSVDRALDVLNILSQSDGMTLSQVSERLGQSPATIYRVLSTLESRGMLETDPQSQTWHVGPAAFVMGSAFLRRSSVIERSRPFMRQLTEITGETSNLGIEKDRQVMFVSQVETGAAIRAFFPPGTLSPMHASGIGKALLSTFSEDRLTRYLKTESLTAFTSRTLVAPNALRREMETVRSAGYAYDNEEKAEGMRCVAAPILNVHGEAVAGISVSGPTIRMTDERIAEFGRHVSNAASAISQGQAAD